VAGGSGGAQVLERRDVWALSAQNPWHPTIEWYARGVKAMQARDSAKMADPRSWRHHAAAHGTDVPARQRPRGSHWNACEHGSWYFLPWHRIYLHHFEKTIREAIVGLGGPATWTLPYWNYSDQLQARALPPAFRQTTMPNSADPNPLYVAERDPDMNATGVLQAGEVDAVAALNERNFSSAQLAGFGGRSGASIHFGSHPGAVENTPHGSVHMGVGGTDGWMSDFNTAPLDPIFWLHHANIDRLWAKWLAQPGRVNTAERRWLVKKFTFGSGTWQTTLAVRDVLDTTAAPLRYRYGDMPAAAAQPTAAADLAQVEEVAPMPKAKPELIGASDQHVELGNQPSVAEVRLEPSKSVLPQARARASATDEALDAAAAPRTYLRLENVTGTKISAGGYEVHVNVPAGAESAGGHPDHRAGHIALFGVREATRGGEKHTGSGLTFTLDITDLVDKLAADGKLDPQTLRVTFTPDDQRAAASDVRVGRVSLYKG